MINHEAEEIVPIDESGKYFPSKPSRPTIHRWWLKGIRGVKLETIVCGHKRFTSKEAIARFIAAQNAGESPVPAPTVTAKQRNRQAEAAMETLSKAGV